MIREKTIDVDFKMYSEERKITKMVKKILKNYGNSSKEHNQKERELFHLLCYLDLQRSSELFKYIVPNEPGDFLINEPNNKIVVEVVECFGNEKAYVFIKDRVNSLLKIPSSYSSGNYSFSVFEVSRKFPDIIDMKNSKDYYKRVNCDKVVLLVVTGEYDNCPNTGDWMIKFLNAEDINNSFYDIWVLNYFANGRNGNPVAINNLKKSFNDYQGMLN